jgi:thiol-disulfide isomerase/thioredoxin
LSETKDGEQQQRPPETQIKHKKHHDEEQKARDQHDAEIKRHREKRLGLGDKIVIGIVLIVVIGVAYWLSQPPPPPLPASSTAPDFTLRVVGPNGLTGQQVSLSSFRGKVVLLQFMAPECPHCQSMAPILVRLYQKYGANVVFLSVSGQAPNWFGATPTDVADFIHKYGTNWVYVVDSSNSVFNMYGVSSTPTMFIIGKNGEVLNSYVGEITYNTLDPDLARFSA